MEKKNFSSNIKYKTKKKNDINSKHTKKKKMFDALKIETLQNEQGFFFDSCKVLQKIKKHIHYLKWNTKTIEKMERYIPKLKVNTFNPKHPFNIYKSKYTSITKKDKKNGLVYGNILVYINRKISVGGNGEIFKGIMKFPNGENKSIIIKILKKKGNEYFHQFLRESIIQNEIFCDQRKKIGNVEFKSIPKIEMIAKFKEKLEGIIVESYLIGMEELDGDFHQFNDNQINQLSYKKKAKDIGEIYNLYLKSLIQISQKILQLQKNYQFIHNDFHMGNVMYKKIIKNGETVYNWYIIDFGMSCIEKDGIFMCGDKYRKYNETHDLRMLFTSLFENMPPRYVTDQSVLENQVKKLSPMQKCLWKQEAFHIYINQVVFNMGKYANIYKKPVFHNFYEQVKFFEDLNTIPSQIIKNLQNILNMKKSPKIWSGFNMDGEFYSESIVSSQEKFISLDSSISRLSSSDNTT